MRIDFFMGLLLLAYDFDAATDNLNLRTLKRWRDERANVVCSATDRACGEARRRSDALNGLRQGYRERRGVGR
jgi:hypothetical protein